MAKFILQPALNPKHYVMTESMGAVSRWKAMTYKANNRKAIWGDLDLAIDMLGRI